MLQQSLAVLLSEDDADFFGRAMIAARSPLLMSPVNYWEVCSKTLRGFGNDGIGIANSFVLSGKIEIRPVDADQMEIAIEARRKFGKGNHPAKLNLGDCFAYALARSTGQSLLFKGDDFRHTDIEAAA